RQQTTSDQGAAGGTHDGSGDRTRCGSAGSAERQGREAPSCAERSRGPRRRLRTDGDRRPPVPRAQRAARLVLLDRRSAGVLGVRHHRGVQGAPSDVRGRESLVPQGEWAPQGCGGVGGRRVDGDDQPSLPFLLQNKLVDLCEKLQLKRSAVEKFTEVTLPARKVAVQADASAAREVVVQRFNLVRDTCEEEEQHLLEVIHGEEERANQNGLTQRAHWAESLQLISSIRDHLVSALTEMDDHNIVMSTKKILEKAEAADHVPEPLDSKQLDFDSSCTRSPLLLGMWATAALMCRAAPATLIINEKTVSPLLGISADLRTLTFLPKRERKPCEYSPERFDEWPNALATSPFSSGVVTWLVEVKGSSAYKMGVTYRRLARKGKSNETRLGYNVHSWVLSHYDGDYCFSHAGHHLSLHLLRRPSRVGVLLDYAAGQLLFFDPESCAILHSHHGHFEAPLYPAFAVADRSITLLCS
uniref:B-box and SPRY domain containing n=1 Tax=Erpetoichthys calabaricus TaxID=27687 RepID=A0A8C4T121_ERPCA